VEEPPPKAPAPSGAGRLRLLPAATEEEERIEAPPPPGSALGALVLVESRIVRSPEARESPGEGGREGGAAEGREEGRAAAPAPAEREEKREDVGGCKDDRDSGGCCFLLGVLLPESAFLAGVAHADPHALLASEIVSARATFLFLFLVPLYAPPATPSSSSASELVGVSSAAASVSRCRSAAARTTGEWRRGWRAAAAALSCCC